MSIQASVYIVCLNEEENIGRVLASVADFDEVILVDSGSTDKTLEIASQFKNVKASFRKWGGYANQKQYAKNLCSHEWVFSLDGDQVCSPSLREVIIKTLENDKGCDALDIPIVEQKSWSGKRRYLARFVRANCSIRFFRRDKGNYIDVSVHESVKVDGSVKRVSAAIFHFGAESLEETVMKVNKYSSLRIDDKMAKGKKPSRLKLLLVFPLMFIKNYIFKRNFVNGTDGFIGAMTQAYYAFLKEAKLYTRYHSEANKIEDESVVDTKVSIQNF